MYLASKRNAATYREGDAERQRKDGFSTAVSAQKAEDGMWFQTEIKEQYNA